MGLSFRMSLKHPCCSVCSYFIPFYRWLIFRCVDTPYFTSPLMLQWMNCFQFPAVVDDAAILVSCGCPSKLPQTVLFYSLVVLKARGLKSRCWPAVLLLEALGEIPSFVFSSFSWLCQSLTWGHITSTSASVLMLPALLWDSQNSLCLSVIWIRVIVFGPHPEFPD